MRNLLAVGVCLPMVVATAGEFRPERIGGIGR